VNPRGPQLALALALALLLVAGAARAAEAPPASGSGVPAAAGAGEAGLGVLEKESLEEALAARRLKLDPAPAGKTIGTVHVVTLEVFSSRDSFFQFFNIFHRTSREDIVRRDALFGPGDGYDQEIIEETTRNLRDPFLSNVVVIAPVMPVSGALPPGTVDVLIVTRDVWSLRLNTDFEVQQAAIINLTISISENNLFGWRKKAAIVFDMDQGAWAIGPSYLDPNIAGTRLTLRASARAIFERYSSTPEGSSSAVTFAYPLYSLASKWGASISAGHTDGVVRRFLGNRLAPVDFMATPEKERWPWIYRVRRASVTEGVVRSFGRRVIHRVSGGHELTSVRPGFTRDFPDDPDARALFARERFPRSERVSALYLGYGLFTPNYRTYRDLNTFDLREDVRLGPTADVGLAQALRPLGSEKSFLRLSAGASWAFGWLRGYQSAGVSWSGRIESGRLVDQVFGGSVYLATPVLFRVMRVLGRIGAAAILDDTRNSFYILGGDTGLRGYTIGDLFGKAHMLGHAELRSMSLKLASLRVGGLLFYDVGDAASPTVAPGSGLGRALRTVAALQPKHDVGVGVRLLIPQLDAYVLRVDWAFATNQTMYTQPGWPGRVSLGFRQAF
jgi:hypothetical protein